MKNKIILIIVYIYLYVVPVTAQDSKIKLMVLPDGIPESKVRKIVSTVESNLRRNPSVLLIDGISQQKLLKQHAIYQEGTFDTNKIPEAGKFIAAQKVLLVNEYNNNYSMRLIDIETAKVEFATEPADSLSQVSSKVYHYIERRKTLHELSNLDFSEGSIQCSLNLEKEDYVLGEKLKGTLECNSGGYITLLHISKENEPELIFPHPKLGNIKIQKDKLYKFPSGLASAIIELEVEPPYGADYLVLILTPEPISLPATDNAEKVAKGLVAKVKETKGNWGGAKICFETVQNKPQGLCR